jgi:hypothetical protein
MWDTGFVGFAGIEATEPFQIVSVQNRRAQKNFAAAMTTLGLISTKNGRRGRQLTHTEYRLYQRSNRGLR